MLNSVGVVIHVLISGKCESTRSTSSLSSITSNTNEASATLPPFLHPPKLHPPPVHILAVLAQGMSVGVNTELIKKIQWVPSLQKKGYWTDREWAGEWEKDIYRDGSVMGEVKWDVLNESQISATYCICSVQDKSVLSSLSAAHKIFWGKSFLNKLNYVIYWHFISHTCGAAFGYILPFPSFLKNCNQFSLLQC